MEENVNSALLILGHTEPSKMIELITKLKTSSRSFAYPINIVAVCGKDPDTLNKVNNALKQLPSHPDIRVKLEGYLSESQMAKYMKICSRVTSNPGLMVTKSGGSTTAELEEMGVYAICLPGIPGEIRNAIHLKTHGLGEEIDETRFVDQVAQAIKWNGDRKAVYHSPFDWKANLEALVKQKITEATLAKEGKFQFFTANIL
jgi:UDP-N-acetylglucosamine:LPS N-acetylglucosamine transferase